MQFEIVKMFSLFILISFHVLPNFAQHIPDERIITSLELIYGNQGVSVKFSYNETTNSNQLTSVPGCPKSIDGIPWVYYGEPPRCFLAGQYGPCPLGQKLLVMEGSPFGVCACECVVDGEHGRSLELNIQSKPRYIFCNSKGENANFYGQIYDTKDNVCFERGTQGPCHEGELLTGYTPFALKCLPICEIEYGIQGVLNGTNCALIPGWASYALPKYIGENDCLPNEHYSSTLRKCIKTQMFILS